MQPDQRGEKHADVPYLVAAEKKIKSPFRAQAFRELGHHDEHSAQVERAHADAPDQGRDVHRVRPGDVVDDLVGVREEAVEALGGERKVPKLVPCLAVPPEHLLLVVVKGKGKGEAGQRGQACQVQEAGVRVAEPVLQEGEEAPHDEQADPRVVQTAGDLVQLVVVVEEQVKKRADTHARRGGHHVRRNGPRRQVLVHGPFRDRAVVAQGNEEKQAPHEVRPNVQRFIVKPKRGPKGLFDAQANAVPSQDKVRLRPLRNNVPGRVPAFLDIGVRLCTLRPCPCGNGPVRVQVRARQRFHRSWWLAVRYANGGDDVETKAKILFQGFNRRQTC